MKNTDFMNLSLPEGADKIDIEILNNDFTAIENLLKQHAITETMTLNGEGVIIDAIGPYIRLQNIDTVQVSIDIGKETYTLASGENVIIRETAENIGIITSGNVHITYFVNPKTYVDKEFYTKKKVDELLSKVEGNVEVDAELSEISENPVQNKVITAELASYATTAEVESKVTEKVAEIVAGAPEDFDTLKEMSDWLKEHEDSAASMNSAIQKNAEDIETANENISKNAEDIVTVNENIQKNVDDITVVKNSIAINKSTLGAQCKNLLRNTAVSKSEHNANFTVNEDGTITVSTTAVTNNTATLTINSDMTLEPGTYKLTGSSELGENGQLRLYIGSEFKRSGDTFTISEPTKITNIRLFVYTGVEFTEKTVYPMLRYADITDSTYEPYQANVNTRISALETLSDAVYKYHQSAFAKYDTGYVLRVGNQVHINLVATFHTSCAAWVGSIVKLPFKVKTPDSSARYTLKQTQADGRETSIYLQNGGTTFFTSTAFQKGDIITIPSTILDMYVEEAATTEGGE